MASSNPAGGGNPPNSGSKGPLEKALAVFADVRSGEAVIALLMTLVIFLVLTSYYVVKVVREPLIIEAGGAELKSYASTALAILSIGVVWGYDRLYARYARMPLMTVIFVAFAAMLALFFLLNVMGVPVGVPFFLYAGLYGAFIIAIFWSFANDIYDADQGKRLFPLIAVGSTAGGVAGSALSRVLIEPLGVYLMMLLAAGLLFACLGLLWLVERLRDAGREVDAQTAKATDAPAPAADADDKSAGGFKLILSQRYLLLLALLIMMLNWVNTTGEFILDLLIEEEADRITAEGGDAKKYIGAFRAEFFLVVNIAVVTIQALLVSRAIKYLGIRLCLMILPLIAVGGYVTLLIVPTLMAVRMTKTAENSIDYSLQNTVQQALYLVTTREEKYKAKAAIDTFFKRAGDVLSTGVVLLGSYLAFGIRDYVIVNVCLALVWVGIAIMLGREYAKREAAAEDAKTETTSEAS